MSKTAFYQTNFKPDYECTHWINFGSIPIKNITIGRIKIPTDKKLSQPGETAALTRVDQGGNWRSGFGV